MARIRNYKKIKYDSDLNKAQENVSQAFAPFIENEFLYGLILKNVQLKIGINNVSHKLGRKLEGFVVTRQRALAQIYDTQDTNVNVSTSLQLVSSADVSIDLYVF